MTKTRELPGGLLLGGKYEALTERLSYINAHADNDGATMSSKNAFELLRYLNELKAHADALHTMLGVAHDCWEEALDRIDQYPDRVSGNVSG